MLEIHRLLERILELDASDLYLTVGSPPVFRVEGVAKPVDEPELSAEDTAALAASAMSDPRQREEFARTKEMNLALSLTGRGRFRCNVFQQRNSVGLVIRQIKLDVPSIDDLGLPGVLKDIALTKRGLVLVTGATGSGKSTTQAAMSDHRNTTTPGHIVTIEDPIEFIHSHKKSIVTQREVGFDTLSFHEALRNTLRQAPDVILIGEVRDEVTMEAAITFAETGHLCLATLHSNNANQTIERIINFFPAARHNQIYLELSLNLRGIISQRLIPGTNGRRVVALEILLDTPRVKDLIKKAEIDTLKEALEQGTNEGCQTFDESLFRLARENRIEIEQALIHADSANNLRLRLRNEELANGQEPKEQPSFRIQGHRGFGGRGLTRQPTGSEPTSRPTGAR
ncbi:MAG TPA: PilT/PilU family type 4a pilus ATPase [Candidatus Binatia bacterium]|nr:PilT/PilU family type 4a pilus ATPase [Candidatus Binatia bacterium]